MSTVFTWVINTMNTVPSEDGLTDVVDSIEAIRYANNGDYVCTYPVTYKCGKPSSTDFTAYDDLTYNQVCGWLDNGLDVTKIDAHLESTIYIMMYPPTVVLPNPWEPAPTTTSTTTTTTTEAPVTTTTTEAPIYTTTTTNAFV